MNKNHILIVDDEINIASTLLRALKGKFGENAEVATCTSAEDAVHKLNLEAFDLLITDWQLPQMSGLDLATWARQTFPDLKIIFMTASPLGEFEDGIRKVSDLYVTKPFKLPAIMFEIDNLLQGK